MASEERQCFSSSIAVLALIVSILDYPNCSFIVLVASILLVVVGRQIFLISCPVIAQEAMSTG